MSDFCTNLAPILQITNKIKTMKFNLIGMLVLMPAFLLQEATRLYGAILMHIQVMPSMITRN